jgi:RNA polymerase-binding transcription factor
VGQARAAGRRHVRRTGDHRLAVRDVLLAERARVTAQLETLTRDFDRIVDASLMVGNDDEHDPEGTTIAFERAQVAALLSDAQRELSDIDRALERLRDGTYGVCAHCGKPIAPERLAARPSAAMCIDCASIGW